VILQRYILKELLVSFLLIFIGVAIFIFFGSVYELLRKYQTIWLCLAIDTAPYLIILAMPYTILVAGVSSATVTYGNLSSSGQILAISTCGLCVRRILPPAIFLGAILSISLYYLQADLIPSLLPKRKAIINTAIFELLRSPPPDRNDLRLGRFRINYASYKDGRFKNLRIISLNEKGKPAYLYDVKEGIVGAFRAGSVEITLIDGILTIFDPEGKPKDTSSFAQITRYFEMAPFTPRRSLKEFTSCQLAQFAGSLSKIHSAKALALLHLRNAASLAPLVLVIFSTLIGMCVSKGSKVVGLGLAIPILLLYFFARLAVEAILQKGSMQGPFFAYLPLLVIAILSIPFYLRLHRW
jgi:lipopolysaccharide export LptBFGC system permease protein LptF